MKQIFPASATGGDTAALIRAFPWHDTGLGPPDSWHPSMKTTVGLILRSPVPIVTLWGEQGYMIYNDAYSVFAGGRHPALLGSEVRKGWPEVADFNDNVMRVVMAGGTLTYVDQELVLQRNGLPEPAWMNLDYSPVAYDDGTIGGVIAVVVETTAKIRAERRISEERARLDSMHEQAPGFMALVTGPQHRFDLANAAYRQLAGQGALIGRTMREVFPDRAQFGLFERLEIAYRDGQVVSGTAVPFTLPAASRLPRRERYLDYVFQPLKDSAGKVFGIFIQGSDVTEAVLAEHARRDSEAKFHSFAHATTLHIWTADAAGHFDWFNERLYQYAGLQPDELPGTDWTTLVFPEDAGAVQRAWQAAVRGGTPFDTEVRMRRHDGFYRWHLVRAVPIAGDHAVRWIGSNTDIDDQKSAAESLASMNATLEQRVAHRTAERDRMWRLSKDILLVADFHGILSAVSPAFTSVLGWTERDVIGKSFLDLVHPDDQEPTVRQIAALSAGAQMFRFENRYRRKDGSYCALSWTASPDARYIHAIGRDITADLEQACAMRRTEVALQQAQKMETIGKLTGGVAHDFNNLLQVISGNLQLVQPLVRDRPAALVRLDNALAGVERGAKLASYLLAFARRQPLEPKVVKVSRLITGMEDMLRRTLGAEVEIETVMSGGLWSASIDVAQVENAILNLAINARDAMDNQGRLTIEVNNAFLDTTYCAAHPDVVPGQYVMIGVSDTGTGMTPDVMAQAFDPFFSTKPEGKGTGLGLSMVYGLVKQSGGHIKIYSEPGEGTTVKLYLPRSRAAEDAYTVLDRQPAVGGNETVLVAEDDEEVRGVVVDMLTQLGYRVLKAHDAASALTVIDSGIPVDLLFTDVVMPGPLRSPELARKAKERLPDIAVLFTSGYTENAIVHGGRLDAGVELIGKPYTRESLARKVRHVLANERQRRQAVPEPSNAGPARAVAGPALTVLLVEDDHDIRMNTRDLIELLGHTVLAVATAEEAIPLLCADIGVLLTDQQLPGMQGDELIRHAQAAHPGMRAVLASGYGTAVTTSAEVTVLPKPYGLETLRALFQSP